jgi:hypothetical protein
MDPNLVTPALPHMDIATFLTCDSLRLGRLVCMVLTRQRHHENFTSGFHSELIQRLRQSSYIVLPSFRLHPISPL